MFKTFPIIVYAVVKNKCKTRPITTIEITIATILLDNIAWNSKNPKIKINGIKSSRPIFDLKTFIGINEIGTDEIIYLTWINTNKKLIFNKMH